MMNVMSTVNSPASVSDLHVRGKHRASIEKYGLSLRRVPVALQSVDVWALQLDAATDSLPQHLLSRDERDRAARFRNEDDRHRFVAAHVALRTLLGHYLDVAPDAIEFDYALRGKPALARSVTGLRFNLSHTTRVALFALSSRAPVGIDAEDLDRRVDHAALAKRLLTSCELAAFEQLAPDQRAHAFLRCWTRKEAIAKALGSGLALPFDKIEAGIEDENAGVFRRLVNDGTRPTAIDLCSIRTSGYTATVAIVQRSRLR
jgi:4'-phosphopantetheinyl transferase